MKAASFMPPASEPQPCYSESASSAASKTCQSPPSPCTSSFYQHSLSTRTCLSLSSFSLPTSKTHQFSVTLMAYTASFRTPAAKSTAKPSPSLLPQTKFLLSSSAQSHCGFFSSDPCQLNQNTAEMSQSFSKPAIDSTEPVQSHKVFLQTNLVPSTCRHLSRPRLSLLPHAYPLWPLLASSQLEYLSFGTLFSSAPAPCPSTLR